MKTRCLEDRLNILDRRTPSLTLSGWMRIACTAPRRIGSRVRSKVNPKRTHKLTLHEAVRIGE
ncbi:hypothetical protein C7S17_4257 [Burkholderia thailandensis]|nr:hypothetical protein [Burkholderia thailandensis]